MLPGAAAVFRKHQHRVSGNRDVPGLVFGQEMVADIVASYVNSGLITGNPANANLRFIYLRLANASYEANKLDMYRLNAESAYTR